MKKIVHQMRDCVGIIAGVQHIDGPLQVKYGRGGVRTPVTPAALTHMQARFTLIRYLAGRRRMKSHHADTDYLFAARPNERSQRCPIYGDLSAISMTGVPHRLASIDATTRNRGRPPSQRRHRTALHALYTQMLHPM